MRYCHRRRLKTVAVMLFVHLHELLGFFFCGVKSVVQPFQILLALRLPCTRVTRGDGAAVIPLMQEGELCHLSPSS